MGKNIIFIEKEIEYVIEKRIKSNLRKIGNALQDLEEMGYSMYLTPNSLNVCDGDTHPSTHQDQSVVVASLTVFNIDAGDW
ncbi:MAG: hypothetical protein ACRCST_05605 [Turicibacter sp.]